MSALQMPAPVLGRGFADPVRQAQSCFRTLLDAMSRPGRVMALPTDAVSGLQPPGLGPVMTALLLTLLDAEVDVWLDPAWSTRVVRNYLRFHTDVRWAESRATARFVAMDAADADDALWDGIGLGSDESPQDGATVLIAVPRLQAVQTPAPGSLICRGPGIQADHRVQVSGIEPAFWQARARLAERLPQGAELILCDEHQVVALPRTTRIALQD